MTNYTAQTLEQTLRSVVVENQRVVFLESIVALVLLWHVCTVLFGLESIISSPALVYQELTSLLISMEWVEHAFATMRRIIIAFVITMIIGTGLGVLMGLTDFWEGVLKNYVSIGITLPELLIAVFAAMWFGISDITPIVTGSVIAFPFVTQIIYEGIKDIDDNLVVMTRSFDVSRRRFIRRVMLQSIMPEWFSGARAGFAICWKLVTLAEFIAAANGLGFMIEYEMSRRSLEGVIAWTLIFTIIILIVEYGIFRQVERRVFAWREDIKTVMA